MPQDDICKARKYYSAVRVSQEALTSDRLSLLDWEHIFGGSAVGHLKAVNRAEQLSDAVHFCSTHTRVAVRGV